ncbi:hypothetical protein WJX84_012375 [Apatococcus fuscideae]|uniref:Myb-like domain-containing protein n=1 Tax=Apatococcus fuscideae TaxID=2026836 RepID=A0AAW1TD74_9CHLO
MPPDFTLPPPLTLDQSGSCEPAARQDAASSGTVKKGQPWSEAEHLQFLAGLKKLGKGNWRGISKFFCPALLSRRPVPTVCSLHLSGPFLTRGFRWVRRSICRGQDRPHHDQLANCASFHKLSSPVSPSGPAVHKNLSTTSKLRLRRS